MPSPVFRLFVLLLAVAPVLGGDPPAAPPKDLDVYLLIGQSNMSGRAAVPEDATGVIDRCYLLNDKNEWEPARNPLNRHSSIGKGAAMQKLGPGYAFVKKMLEADKDATIGLVVNARGGSKIDEWTGEKPKYYWEARKRTKIALQSGTLKGVLWHQGESDSEAPDGYLAKLKSLVANLRSDFGDTDLHFVAGEVHDVPAINEQLARLPAEVHGTGCVSADGLSTTDRWHFDTKSQLLLGERYAAEMLRLRAAPGAGHAPKPPADIRFIDTHVHAMAATDGGLDPVARWMEQRNIERCIVSPLNHQGSRAWTEEERVVMLANHRKYAGRIDRMCIIDPGEVETVDEAVAILKREIADGAVAFGEHYGKDLIFDDPKNLLLYEACEKVGLPVMFHIDQNKNMVEPGMKRVDRVLEMFPDCKVIAHAYWWRQLGNGSCDRQLSEHPNLYADMSGQVVVNVLNRDRKYAREFIIRHADKLLFGTDEGWWSFGDAAKQMNLHYTFFEELDLPDDVRRKLYRGNAERLFGLVPKGD